VNLSNINQLANVAANLILLVPETLGDELQGVNNYVIDDYKGEAEEI